MSKVSIIIPARNEQFLIKTIQDILEKAAGDIEIIAVLENYWPEDIAQVQDERVSYIHFGTPRGMRGAINAGVAIARGDYVMKLDAHCMLSPGFDTILSSVCRDNWVCVPTRYRLDAENWKVIEDGRPRINYLYVDLSNDEFNGKLWQEKNKDRTLDELYIDDLIACQGSCYFMPRDHFYAMGLLDEENYGTFRKDPQEVLFKTWTSGGRCVRVKGTREQPCWYAHLHKGKRYGRGYHASSSDWHKGDEYVKKWWTNDAWDERQTIPLEKIFAKFADMPGWENHPWTKGKPVEDIHIKEEEPPPPPPQVEEGKNESPILEEKIVHVEAEIKDYSHLPNLYQYLEVNGEPFSRPRPERANSRFWNEGRWENFVSPLLPQDPYTTEKTFVEMGAASGLFLKMAVDEGFHRVIGIEKNQTPVKEGLRYRDTIGYTYTLLKRKLGSKFHEEGSFDINELPVADITLYSTFHYYIDINAWIKYVDSLINKTCYVLFISRPSLKQEHWRARAEKEIVKEYFPLWREVGSVDYISKEGDPAPRDLYSILLANPFLRRVSIDSIDIREKPTDPMYLSMMDLANKIASGNPFDLFDTEYYHRWTKRKKGKWSERTTRGFVQMKADNMESVMRDGLMDPILVEKDTLRLCDGGHRLAMIRTLGLQSVIVREIPH